MNRYEVKKVFFKEYGGHDNTTAWGTVADDSYRQSERDKWNHMKACIEKQSTLHMVETISDIEFEGTVLHLYSTGNYVQKIWEDESIPDTYHKNAFGENINSLAVYFEVNGKTVFLGGDVMDHEAPHPLARFRNLQIA